MKPESREIALAKQVADLRAALGLAREASKDMRRAGRAEALAILLAHGAEGIGDFIGSHPIADTGDFGEHWEKEKLRELLDLTGDDPTLSVIDRLDGKYWGHVAVIDELRERAPAAAIRGNTYESITGALDLPELSGDCTQRINQLIEKVQCAPAATLPSETNADDLRALGWSVAVHNDYRLRGEAHTFGS